MKLDLRRDFGEIYDYLADRVRGFDPTRNDGPGQPGPVRVISVGFEFSQSAWVTVVFDTRPDFVPDNHWQLHIMGNLLERPRWLEADEANMNGLVTLIQRDGSELTLPAQSELAEPLGELLKAVVLKARHDGVFAGLNKAAGCEVVVEHHEGAYCWPVSGAPKEEV